MSNKATTLDELVEQLHKLQEQGHGSKPVVVFSHSYQEGSSFQRPEYKYYTSDLEPSLTGIDMKALINGEATELDNTATPNCIVL